MAAKMEDADLIGAIAEGTDHVGDRRVMDREQHIEARPAHRSERLGDHLALVEQAPEMTLVIDPVVGEREEDSGHRQLR